MQDIYLQNYVKGKEDKQIVYDEFFVLISNINSIEYSQKGDIISKLSNVSNALNYLLFGSNNVENNILNIIEKINDKIKINNLRLTLEQDINICLYFTDIKVIYANIAPNHSKICLPLDDILTLNKLHEKDEILCNTINLWCFNDMIEQIGLYSIKKPLNGISLYNYLTKIEALDDNLIVFLLESDLTIDLISQQENGNTLLHEYLVHNSKKINSNIIMKMLKHNNKTIKNANDDTYLDVYIQNSNIINENIVKLLQTSNYMNHNYPLHKYINKYKDKSNVNIIKLLCNNDECKNIIKINNLDQYDSKNTALNQYLTIPSPNINIIKNLVTNENKLLVDEHNNSPLYTYIKYYLKKLFNY